MLEWRMTAHNTLTLTLTLTPTPTLALALVLALTLTLTLTLTSCPHEGSAHTCRCGPSARMGLSGSASALVLVLKRVLPDACTDAGELAPAPGSERATRTCTLDLVFQRLV
jgi:hypothetical protein